VLCQVDGFLDLARSIFCRLTEQIHDMAESLRTELELPSLKVPNHLHSPCSCCRCGLGTAHAGVRHTFTVETRAKHASSMWAQVLYTARRGFYFVVPKPGSEQRAGPDGSRGALAGV
jgi:hypothetical protein